MEKRKIKIFISLPMCNKTDAQIRRDFEKKKEKLRERGYTEDKYEIIDSIIGDGAVEGNLIEYLAKSINLMAYADIIFFSDGWESARGCRIEHNVATDYGKEVIYE